MGTHSMDANIKEEGVMDIEEVKDYLKCYAVVTKSSSDSITERAAYYIETLLDYCSERD